MSLMLLWDAFGAAYTFVAGAAFSILALAVIGARWRQRPDVGA